MGKVANVPMTCVVVLMSFKDAVMRDGANYCRTGLPVNLLPES